MSAVATVKGGLFEAMGVNSLTSMQGTGASRRTISQQLSDTGLATIRARASALNGVVAGSVAATTRGRIEASEELGGKRVIETDTLINRVTTAADITEINADLLSSLTSRTTFGASPVANKDGNPLGTR